MMGVPHFRSGWGYPIPGLDGRLGTQGTPPPGLVGGGYPPNQVLMVGGVPRVPPQPPGLDGVPIPPPIRQSNIASTCYAAGGVPLAFTQEDFLVTI